ATKTEERVGDPGRATSRARGKVLAGWRQTGRHILLRVPPRSRGRRPTRDGRTWVTRNRVGDRSTAVDPRPQGETAVHSSGYPAPGRPGLPSPRLVGETGPMIEPVDAMRRIAFLLERSGADTYRVQAFRGAATALLTTGEEEVRRRAADGTLTDIGGIGNRTAGVVREALAGQTPEYLAKLEESSGPLVPGGESMRAA